MRIRPVTDSVPIPSIAVPAVLLAVGVVLDVLFHHRRTAILDRFVDWWYFLATREYFTTIDHINDQIRSVVVRIFGTRMFSMRSFCNGCAFIAFLGAAASARLAIQMNNWSLSLFWGNFFLLTILITVPCFVSFLAAGWILRTTLAGRGLWRVFLAGCAGFLLLKFSVLVLAVFEGLQSAITLSLNFENQVDVHSCASWLQINELFLYFYWNRSHPFMTVITAVVFAVGILLILIHILARITALFERLLASLAESSKQTPFSSISAMFAAIYTLSALSLQFVHPVIILNSINHSFSSLRQPILAEVGGRFLRLLRPPPEPKFSSYCDQVAKEMTQTAPGLATPQGQLELLEYAEHCLRSKSTAHQKPP